MAKPVWDITQPSNTSLGTFIERKTLGVGSVPIINLLVSDPANESILQTQQFLDNVETYASEYVFYTKSNGLPRTPWLGQPARYDRYTPKAQSYVFQFIDVRDSSGIQPKNPIAAINFIGVAIDGVPFRSPNSRKITKLGGQEYTENKVINPLQGYFTDGSGIIESDEKFFYHSDPALLYTKDPTQHSPILGYALDGLPIYGPYGYSDPDDETSSIKIIETSYRVKSTNRANGSRPDGSFIEDFEYVEGLGDLDQYNSRYCKTPDYPTGIQAYFVTVDPDDISLPRYPYIIGPQYWGTPFLYNNINGDWVWPGQIDISLISGKLPGGLRLEGSTIIGTPYAVLGTVTSRFVLRAKNPGGICDRTFTITITGEGESIAWTTPTGSLPVGTNNRYYILDNSLIDFHLDAIDKDMPSGKYLNYHIPPNGGQLPGGITLSTTGHLYGFTAPILAVETGSNNGNYDTTLYSKDDITGYDYGVRPINGYDSFYFDNQIYDYFDPNRAPRKLNRYYQFIVRASDGVRYVDRKFQIYVVGDDYFRADNDILRVGTNTYTADNTYMRKPIWITRNYIGRLRANNYITIILDVFDPASLEGTIGYILNPTNPDDGSPSVLPPGMVLDQLSGEIYGSVPYQPAITKNYKFTINALRYSVDPGVPNVPSLRTFNVDIIGEIDSVIHFTTTGDLGSIDANFISNISINAVTTVPNAVLAYSLVGGSLPPGLRLVNDGTIQGKVNQFSDGVIYRGIWKSNRTYHLNDIIRSPGSSVNYYKCILAYTSGINFAIGSNWVKYIPNDSTNGLVTFDKNDNIFDKFTTTFDRDYTFTIEARDQFNQSATTKTFNLSINTPNNKLYSNIYVKPFLKLSIRSILSEFFNNSSIFEPNLIYRLSDPEYGVQNELKMLLYPGIESKLIGSYVSAFGRSSRKKFRIGNLKKAIAKTPGTNDTVYEVIYLEILDNQENNQKSVSEYIKTSILNHPVTVNQGRRDIIDGNKDDNNMNTMKIDQLSSIKIQDKALSADFSGQLTSDGNRSNIFGNSVTNIRNKIAYIGDTERNYLPLWMRTPQTYSGVEQGFTKAIPICYCLPGYADNIILNIKNSGFDFKLIDFTVDRAIIDSVVGQTGDKYIAFAAREVING